MNFKQNEKKILITLFLMLINFINLYSDENLNLQDSSNQNTKKETILLKNNQDENKLLLDSSRLSQNEFMYANHNRVMFSGNLPYKQTQIRGKDIALVGSILGVAFIAQHIYQEETIWKDKANFKFEEDAIFSYYADKGGHFYGTYFPCYLFQESFLEMGFDDDDASLYSAIVGLGYNTYVEVLDGYGANYGFSPSDFAADIAGAGFYYLQHKVPFFQNFTPKFCYYKSESFGELSRLPREMFIDDYASQTVFMSVNVHNLLPQDLKAYWPDWLELSFGYAARNLFSPGYADPNSELYKKYYEKTEVHQDAVFASPRYIVSLDYDLVKLLPDGGSFWNWVKQGLNHWKFPSPTVEFSKSGTRFYLLFPFMKL